MDKQIGSQWSKWDLHVHTPCSIKQSYGDPSNAAIWDKYIADLENLPNEFKVIGVNDYIFLDGYRRLVAEQAKGRLPNIERLLPVVELRLDKFGGACEPLSRVNYHVIFSDQVSADDIERQFLLSIRANYKLNGQDWNESLTKEGLERLGRAIIEATPTEKRATLGSPLQVAFNNLCLPVGEFSRALRASCFAGNYLTAVGKAEWENLRWDQFAAEKQTIINERDMVFSAPADVASLLRSKESLKRQQVNSKILDCSDAHHFSTSGQTNRIGKCFTWIKADTTFEGLRHAMVEYDQRVFIGERPLKLEVVRTEPTRFIQSISIRKKDGAAFSEKWFDQELPLNADLVAIIGNKGSGKSALADVIGLLGNSGNENNYSFLHKEKFRRPSDNKAQHFSAAIKWSNGSEGRKDLTDSIKLDEVPQVRYIPQSYFEKVCTDVAAGKETDFHKELKSVIFSHVSETYGKSSLDEIIVYRTEEIKKAIGIRIAELHELNKKVTAFEEFLKPEHKQMLVSQLAAKEGELKALDAAPPQDAVEPQGVEADSPATTAKIKLDDLEKRLVALDQAIADTGVKLRRNAILQESARKALQSIDNLRRQIDAGYREIEPLLRDLGIDPATVLKVEIQAEPIRTTLKKLEEEATALHSSLRSEDSKGLESDRAHIVQEMGETKEVLGEPSKKYQAALAAIKEWNTRRNAIIGDPDKAGTVTELKKRIAEVDAIPKLLADAKRKRADCSKGIFQEIVRLRNLYADLYKPVQEFIAAHPLVQNKLQLRFQVKMVDSGFSEGFFEFVAQNVRGSFRGNGPKVIQDILEHTRLDNEDEVIRFVERVDELLHFDANAKESVAIPVSLQIKAKKKNPVEVIVGLYDYLFSLGYLRPQFTLMAGDVDISMLSPGERGSLLLVFYLLIDKSKCPLVIDQPEENLDNKTVAELLVPCLWEAKKYRQVIIVTHNPNLAVVADAEQIVVATHNKKEGNEVRYRAGAIENSDINGALLDILEGTEPAFNNRRRKYLIYRKEDVGF